MPESIPNLWPDEFKIEVQTPYTILQVQATLLSKVTRGILEGTVETESGKEKVQHRLVVIAPAFNGYRHTLLVAIHDLHLAYPAEVRAVVFDAGARKTGYYPRANSDNEMQGLVQRVLQSDETRAVILSLIAQSNEARFRPSVVLQADTDNASLSDQESPRVDSGTGREAEE